MLSIPRYDILKSFDSIAVAIQKHRSTVSLLIYKYDLLSVVGNCSLASAISGFQGILFRMFKNIYF